MVFYGGTKTVREELYERNFVDASGIMKEELVVIDDVITCRVQSSIISLLRS